MNNFIQHVTGQLVWLGEHRGLFLLLIVELFAGVCLLIGFFQLKIKKQNEAAGVFKGGSGSFGVPGNGDPVMILRCKDLYPVYITESFEQQLDVTGDDIKTDIGIFLDKVGSGKDWKLWKKYRSWDGKQPFTSDFYLERMKSWYRLEITRSKDGLYDTFQFRDITEDKKELEAAGFHAPKNPTNGWQNWEKDVVNSIKSGVPAAGDKIMFDEVKRTVAKNSTRYYINGKQYKTEEAFEEALKNGEYTEEDVYVTVNLEKIDSVDDVVGKPVVEEEGTKLDYGHYTGNIDKNWSINLIEASTGVAELIEKAELYRATATDYASYSKYTDEIMPKAVYLKVTLKKEWKTTDSETMKYYVYVAKNNGSTKDKTNEVWVSGTYENTDYEYVNFDWTNNANEAKLWKVRKGENGTAVFDFADKAFFTVKMYSGESMYLDLSTAYDKTIAGEMDVEADSFYKFDNENANFSRSGELVIVSDDDSLVPYSIEDGELVKVDAEYVENYAIAHTNTKVNGFVFKTKQLGNYVLATEEIDEEVEEPAKDEKPAEENKPAEEVKPETKPNPETGAEDFVGLAVSLAVVSVAAAGALALKK